jgi:hypothetical protein
LDPAHRRLIAMDDCDKGYRIGGVLHPWGTTFEEPAARPCSSAYGFETLYVELTAADTGRPVTCATYELANVTVPKAVFANLVKQLGQPDEIDREDEVSGAGSPDRVVLYAIWRRDNHEISVSLYGAPRASDFGDGIGKLYLSWSDTVAAAGPMLEQWHAANTALAQAAETPQAQAIFDVAWPTFNPEDEPLAEAWQALNMPELLKTPNVIANRLGETAFAIWQSAGIFYISHGRATVAIGGTPVQYNEIEPARGGGYASIEIGSWYVRDEHKSPAIAEAVALLARIPGLTIERHDGYNV